MDLEDLSNRFSYHVPKNTKIQKNLSVVRELCFSLAEDLNVLVPEGREKALAITNLE